MSLIIQGRGTRKGELPISEAEALDYFRDIKAFVAKIQEVEKIEEGPGGGLLVSHSPLGAMNYFVTLVYNMTCTWHEHGVRFGAAPFDLGAIKSPHQLVKGEVLGHLTTRPIEAKRTEIELEFGLQIDLPIPFALKFVPEALVRTTADGIMTLRVAASVDSMYRKVEQDFGLR